MVLSLSLAGGKISIDPKTGKFKAEFNGVADLIQLLTSMREDNDQRIIRNRRERDSRKNQ